MPTSLPQNPSELRLRLLVASTEDYAIFTFDCVGCLDSWNIGATRLLGYKESEAVGKNIAMLYTPEDCADGVPALEMGTAVTVGRADDERFHLRQDGTRFYANGELIALRDNDGVLHGFAKIMRDLTERRQMEDDLRASEENTRRSLDAVAHANEALETRVEARTADLAKMSERRQDLLRRLVTVQEEEQGRISRDLHDDAGQLVTALLLGLGTIKESPSLAGNVAVQHAIAHLQAVASELALTAHRLAFTLRPTVLDDMGLLDAVRSYAEEWSRWSRIPVDLQDTRVHGVHPIRLAPEIETTIYRIVQEALTNILRHATGESAGACAASYASITVQNTPNELLVVIEDDGPGFDAEADRERPQQERRLGVFGMEERASLVGGRLTIESEIGRGTAVFVRLPHDAVRSERRQQD